MTPQDGQELALTNNGYFDTTDNRWEFIANDDASGITMSNGSINFLRSPSSGTADAALSWSTSVFINDNESGLHYDYEKWLEELAPHEPIDHYRHNDTGEDNADAHLKRQVMGREVVVAITNGQLDFGPWETIFYGEFDGRRNKRVLVKIIGE